MRTTDHQFALADDPAFTELTIDEARETDGGWIPVLITVVRLAANPYVRAAVVGAAVGIAAAVMSDE